MPLPRLTPSPAVAATEPARTPRSAPGAEPLPVRTHDGLLYWSEPDAEGGWRCGRCETGLLASSAVGTTCSVCHAAVVELEERRSGGLGWVLVLGLLGLGAGWAAFTFWW